MPDEPSKYKLPWELPSEASKNPRPETFSSPTNPAITPQQTQPQPSDLQPDKPSSKSKIIIVLVIFGLFLLVGAGIFGFLIFKGIEESSQAQLKLTSFLRHVSNNDLGSAYNLTSSEFKQVTTLENFEEEINLYKAQYSDFQKLEQTGFNIEAQTGRPTTYQYSGIIKYTDGDEGEVEAILIKEEGDYKVQYIYVAR